MKRSTKGPSVLGMLKIVGFIEETLILTDRVILNNLKDLCIIELDEKPSTTYLLYSLIDSFVVFLVLVIHS